MTPSEREEIEKMREISAQLWCLPEHSHKEMDGSFCESIAQVILTQVAKARKEALEEAAKIVENFTNDSFKVVSHEYEKFHNKKIASEIRNKLEKEEKK